MTFESGDACPGGIQRRADVIFSCGPKLAIAEASEPSICSYVLRATSPAACQVDRLNRKLPVFVRHSRRRRTRMPSCNAHF